MIAPFKDTKKMNRNNLYMRLFLPLLFTFFFLGTNAENVLAQNCQTPAVTLPAAKSYCGSRTIAFSNTNTDHKPTYSGTITSYSWSVDGVVKATNDYPAFSFQEGRTYQVSITVSSSCGTATATQAITVEARPNPPVVENGGMCTGAEGTLWVTSPNPNLIYKWYNVSSGGSALVWGSTFTTSTPGDYYVEALTKAGCTSSSRTKATLTASSPTGNSGEISISNQQVCSGTSPGTISGNAPNSSFMTYQWYLSTTGADSDFFPIEAARGRDYTPSALSQSTWFKRIAYNGFCGQESNVIKITVIPRPLNPVVDDVVVCYDTQATFRVTNADQNTVYKWYTSATITTSIGTGPVFQTPQTLKTNTSFFVEASTTTNSACGSTTGRFEVKATVTPPITANTITADQSLCSGGTPNPLEGSVPQGGSNSYIYQWQQSENGSGFTDITGANARDFAPSSLSTTTWYRRKVSSASSCPVVTSNVVRISVAPLPVSINITEPVTSCAGAGTTITITNADPAAYTYRWYDVATGGSILRTGSSFPTGPLTSDKTYYVEATTAAGCISNRRPVTVTVTNIPAPPVAGGITVCAGSSATLAVNSTDATLFYRWYNSAGALLATGTSYPTGPVPENTTFYVEAVTKASPGCTSLKEPVTVTVLQPIDNNTIAANQELCSGGTPNPLSGTIPTGGGGGYTYQWQYSEDGTLFTNITGATGKEYAPGALTTTWFRRRVSAAGTCSPVFSNTVKIDINQLPPAPVVPGKTICTGTQATLQVTSPDANLTYKWYTVASGGIPVETNLSSFTTETLTSNKTYYIEAVTDFGCISAIRRAVTVTVVQLPPVPGTDNVTVCAGSKATLSVLSPDPDLAYQWFDAAQGGTLLATGTSITTTSLSASTTYYVQAVTSTNCASSARKAVIVTVVQLPAIPDVAGATICSGGSTTLYINNPEPGLIYRWYSGSTLLATGTSFPTGNLSSGASYYVDAVTDNATACASPGGRTVVVNVIPPITNNTVTASQTICSGGTPATLSGTGPAGGSGTLTYQWEKSENGVSFTSIAGATNPTYTSEALATTTWYRRRVKGTDSCPDNASNAIQITVNALPATPVADAVTVCTGIPATLSVNAPVAGLTYKWYNAASGGRMLSTMSSFTTDNLEANTTFYVEATNASGCISARRPVTVTVRDLPEMPAADSKNICAGQNTTLSVISPNSAVNYRWYDADGRMISGTTSLSLTNVQATTTYYLEAVYATSPACASPRREVTVTVTPLPNLPTVADISVCSGTKGVLQVQGAESGISYKWYTASAGGTAIFTGPTFETPAALTSDKTYYVEASTVSGCLSGRESVTVTVNTLPETPFAANAEVCAGASALLAISDADALLTYQWYATNTAAVPLAIGETFPTGPLQATITYYVEAMTAAGCVSATRSAVTVNVTPLPPTPNADNAITCAGSFAVLTVKNPGASLLYKWYKDDGTYLATGIDYNTGSLNDNATYYVEAVTDNSTACASATRRTVTVTVNPVITNNTISSEQTICSGSSPAALRGAASAGGQDSYTFRWEYSTDGINFNTIQGAIEKDFAPGILSVDTWFRRTVSTAGPCAASISNIIRITVSPMPAAPVAGSATICSGNTATLSINNPVAGYTYRWYSVATDGNVLRTATTYTTDELQANTTYYVEAVTGGGCISPRRAVTVNVTPVPDAPLVPDKTICVGGQAVLAVSAADRSLVYRWYNSDGDLIATGATHTTETLSSSATYYAEAATTTTPACVSNRSAVRVTVTPLPATPVVPDASVCAGGTAVLPVQVVDPTLTYKWYTSATGGTAVATGTTYSTGTLTSGRTYYVEATTASGCASPRASIRVDVTPQPATPAASNAAICAGQTATLEVTNPDTNLSYKWYDAATDGNLLTTGDTYTTGTLSAGATYFVEAVTATGCASNTRKAVTVNVTPLPAAPEADNVTICAGSSATLWVKNQEPNVIYNWYSGGALAGTGISFTTGNLSNSTTYYLEAVTDNGIACAGSARSAVMVTVTPAVANNLINASQRICSGSTPATLTGTLPNGGGGNYSYQWERSEDGINFTAIANATNQNYTPNALSITTWFRRKVSAAGPCAESISRAVQITITPVPATPAADDVTICEGSTATLNIKNGNAAYTYRWYTTPAGGSAVFANTSYTTRPLESTTTFYVEAVNATGCVSQRRTVTVSVMPLPEAPLAADQNICAGEQATLAVSNQAANLTYSWYNGNGDLLATGTTYTTPAPLNNNTTFYVEASSSATPSCTSGRTAVAVNVAARPATPLADNVSICAGSAAGLAVKGIIPGLSYRWYTVATGGLPVHTGSNYSTAALTTGRTYYVEAATASGCTSVSRKAVVVSVIQPPAAPTAADKTICAGQQVTLTVSNPDASLLYQWYDQSGAPLATGNSFTTTTAPAASTTFYVAAATQTSPSCTSPREAIAVTVTPLPAKPEVGEATVCAGSTATLWISNVMPSTIYKWYDENDALQGTGPSFTTPALAAGTTYFVAAETANGCASASRETVVVNVVQPVTNNVVNAAQTICYGGSPAMLTGSQPLGGSSSYTYQWENSEDGINFRSIANAAGKDYTPGALTATTWFRRSAAAGSTCSANISAPIMITVIPLPAIPPAANATVCAGANAVLTVASPNTDLTYRWYATATGGGSIATGSSFTATSVSTTTTYFVEAVNGSGCNSARRAVTVYVIPLPDAPQAADKTICAGEQTTLSVMSPDAKLVYNWYDANGVLQRTGSSFTTPTLDRTTLYYVEAVTTEQACPSPRKAVRITVTQQPATPLVDNVTVCAGNSASMAVKNYDASLTYKWYTAAAGGIALATGPTFNTTNLTSGRKYYVEAATATSCLSARTAVTVDVTPLPALPVVSNQAICAGETATFAVADENTGLTYRWYNAPLGGTLLATGNTFTTGNLNRSSSYYVEAVTAGGCVSLSRRPAVATVSPLPAAPAVENATTCSGEAVTLWVKNPDPALQYKWYSDAAATEQIGSGISYTSPAILANQQYFVKAVNANNCASPALKQVDVRVISKPGVPLVENVTVCAGGNTMLSVSAPDPTVVYKWYNLNSTLLHTGTTYTTEALTANATYTVTAYAAANQTCASASQTVTVTVIPAITDNEISDNQVICYNSAPAKLTGTFPAGGGSNLLYQWERSQDGVNFTDITGGNAQDYTSGALIATTWFRRKVRTAGPCPESISNVVKITVSPLPNAPLADNTTTCAGSSAILTVKSALSGMTYSWYDAANGGTFLGTGISYTTDALTMNSTFYVEATNAPGCTSSSRRAVVVSVESAVGNNIIRDVPPICYGETPEKLTGTPPTGTSNGYTYQWQRSGNGVKFLDIPGATAQNYTPTEAYTKTTWFRRKVIAIGPCPESYSNLVKLGVVPLPAIPVAASVEVCPGSSAILSAAAANGEMLEWYDAPTGGNLLHQGNTYTTPTLNATALYFVQAVNSTGCISSERREVKAEVVVPQAKVSGDAAIFYGKAVRLTAEGGVSYQWYPETGLSDPTSASPMASPKETTTYTVTVTTAGGCTATNQLTVTVSPKVEPANAITPNGDGYNDVFQIQNLAAYENCTVQIFSRWGEIVFESRGYTTPWDGTKKGQPLPMGAYYYIIHLNGTEAPISGSVTLVK